MRLGVVCDVGEAVGAGHAVRCLALVDALRNEAEAVAWFAPLKSVAWVHALLPASDELVSTEDEAGLEHQIASWAPDLLIVDSYILPTTFGEGLLLQGAFVVSISDPATPARPTSLAVEPGFSTITSEANSAPCASGASHVLLREAIVRQRDPDGPAASSNGVRRGHLGVLLGGTQSAKAVWAVASPLARIPGVTVHVNAPMPADFRSTAYSKDVAVHPRDASYWQTLRSCQLVVSAAGVSAWELACLGIPTGLLLGASNQEPNYWGMTARGWALGFGSMSQVESEPDFIRSGTVAALRDSQSSSEMANRAWKAVDGLGSRRVADLVMRHLDVLGGV